MCDKTITMETIGQIIALSLDLDGLCDGEDLEVIPTDDDFDEKVTEARELLSQIVGEIGEHEV